MGWMEVALIRLDVKFRCHALRENAHRHMQTMSDRYKMRPQGAQVCCLQVVNRRRWKIKMKIIDIDGQSWKTRIQPLKLQLVAKYAWSGLLESVKQMEDYRGHRNEKNALPTESRSWMHLRRQFRSCVGLIFLSLSMDMGLHQSRT